VKLAGRVRVVEVGPRDGLQNEPARLSVEDRVDFCNRLLAAGLPVVEAGAFVSPQAVPQMAGSDADLRGLVRPPGTRTPVLVPNRKGYDRARAAGATDVAVFTAATETFNRKNIEASIEESFTRFDAFVPHALRDGVWVRGYVSTAFGCPYEGAVPVARVVEVTHRLIDLGCAEVSIGDTIGVGVPTQVADVIGALGEVVPRHRLAVHFHDTRGTALANVLAALQEGIAVVDASAGGLGGCPFAPGAAGNLATEDLLYMLHGMGLETGVDLDAVAAASSALGRRLGRPLPSRYLQAWRAAGGRGDTMASTAVSHDES
jgi:hydroxymethylglutaryl-CoA lyase